MSNDVHTIEGVTESGRTLRIDLPIAGHVYHAADIWIDGQEARVLRAGRLRDGGTTIWHTDRGSVRLPHRIGDPDHRPRLDGEVVEGAE